VIQRQGDGFPLDQSRAAYLRYLRRQRQQSPRSADADHVKVKTEMLQLRLMEKKRELLRREDFDEAIDSIAGIVLTHLSGMAARCSIDLATRRKIDAVVYEARMAQREMRNDEGWKFRQVSFRGREPASATRARFLVCLPPWGPLLCEWPRR
jgi:hypothetical protein